MLRWMKRCGSKACHRDYSQERALSMLGSVIQSSGDFDNDVTHHIGKTLDEMEACV